MHVKSSGREVKKGKKIYSGIFRDGVDRPLDDFFEHQLIPR